MPNLLTLLAATEKMIQQFFGSDLILMIFLEINKSSMINGHFT